MRRTTYSPPQDADPRRRSSRISGTHGSLDRYRIGVHHGPLGAQGDLVLGLADLRAVVGVTDIGWWIGSAMPGSSRGTVLVVGHVDTARDGPGALFRLETLGIGAKIQIEGGDQAITYRTVARRSYPKQRLPKQLFKPDTPAELALVTCWGKFQHGTYTHNVVVYARPVS